MNVTSPQTGFQSFQVAHGLASEPTSFQLSMLTGGAIWLDEALPFDGTYVYLHASDANLAATLAPVQSALAPLAITAPSTGFSSFAVPHGLGSIPQSALITLTSPGGIWLDDTTPFDNVNLYLHASDADLTALVSLNASASIALPSAGGYCTIPDVIDCFPSFQRNAPGSVQDTRIQAWINQYAARIDGVLIPRGFDPQNPPAPMTARQINFLSSLNADPVIGELARALESNVSLQPGEISVAAGRRRNFEAILSDIQKARYDWLFGLESRLTPGVDDGFESRPAFRKDQVW